MAEEGNGFDPKEYLTKLVRKKRVDGGWVEVENDYLEVKWRIAWLRDAYPDATIVTELIEREEKFALFRATVTLPTGASAVGHGSETAGDFGDFIEKAETKALGRALAALGYGTQFCGGELDEGSRVVDSPVQRRSGGADSYDGYHDGARAAAAPKPKPKPSGIQDINGSPMEDNQRKAIRASLDDLFGKDEKAAFDWMAEVQPKAAQGTEIHLTGLTKAEATAILLALKQRATAAGAARHSLRIRLTAHFGSDEKARFDFMQKVEPSAIKGTGVDYSMITAERCHEIIAILPSEPEDKGE